MVARNLLVYMAGMLTFRLGSDIITEYASSKSLAFKYKIMMLIALVLVILLIMYFVPSEKEPESMSPNPLKSKFTQSPNRPSQFV